MTQSETQPEPPPEVLAEAQLAEAPPEVLAEVLAEAPAGPTRCGYVALLGPPNAGKSTLLNRMAGAKLSIVSPRAQTTRFRILGIVRRARTQILLTDTPGIFRPTRKLDRAMVTAAWSGSADADLSLLIVDARSGANTAATEIAQALAQRGSACMLVLNKTDLVEPQALLPLIAHFAALAPFAHTLMLSAITGEGVAALLDLLADTLPEGPHLYPDDEITDLPDRMLAAEIVREQIFLQTAQEIPYSCTVETDTYKPLKDGSIRIEATVHVSRAAHRPILIGDRGSRIKAIGTAARAELEKLLETRIHLFLNVKDTPDWADSAGHLKALNLD